MSNDGFDEYGNYGENNPPVGDVSNYKETVMTDSTWHYQLMRRKALNINCDVEVPDYYAIHEYYPSEDGDGWTEDPIPVDGDSVEEVKNVLMMMLSDIEKHGVKDYD